MGDKGYHAAIVIALVVVIIFQFRLWWKATRATNKDKMENGSCVLGCPKNTAGCTKDYFMCINACGPDLTSKMAPPCVMKCKTEAANCRQRFLDCANDCGQLWIS